MNVIIPIGGIGSRFSQDNYTFPKPLINIDGNPMLFWVIDNLNIQNDDTIFIAINEEIKTDFALEHRLKTEYPFLNIKLVNILYKTRGALETLLIVLQTMTDDELIRKTISLDCDTIYFEDILSMFNNQTDYTGVVFYFDAVGLPTIFSYIDIDHNNIVTNIKEKELVSDHTFNANTGAYGFKSGELLKEVCIKLLEKTEILKEYYTSYALKYLLPNVVKAINVNDFKCVGTPIQLNTFLKDIKDNLYTSRKKKRFCFDLDNTLVTYPDIKNDYTSVKPKDKNIDILRNLKKNGHYIIIYTARRMKTFNGDVEKVRKDVEDITIDTLKKYDIPYDELHFGKPYADLYIDDLGVNALTNIEKDIGCYLENKGEIDIIKPRYFNNITEYKNTIMKSSYDDNIQGEIFFYKNINSELSYLFPKFMTSFDNTIILEKIKGITFSHLIVSKTLTDSTLLLFLNSIKQLYNRVYDYDNNVYLNYSYKLEQRFLKYKNVYENFIDCDKYIKDIIDKLNQYIGKNNSYISEVIHGDPVFSNVLLTYDNKIKLIDPRGILGVTLSMKGDIAYDLAKILQSLYGYDFIILNKDIDYKFLGDKRKVYINWIQTNFPEIDIDDLLLICRSLILSLIPLHDENNHKLFYKLFLELKN